jgi:hypothetical protein
MNSEKEKFDFEVSWKTTTKKSILPNEGIAEYTKQEGGKLLRWNECTSKFEDPLDMKLIPRRRS